MSKSQAVLFDLDGVLVRTEHLKARAHSETVKRLGGIKVPISLYSQVLGRPFEQVRDTYLTVGGIDADPDEYTRIWRQIYRESLSTDLEATAGVKRLLQRLEHEGYALAVVSSSDSQTLESILLQTSLDRFFAALISADDVERAKPAPDAYLLALDRLALSPTSAVVVEDSEAGVQAAVSAGIRVIAVRHDLNVRQDFRLASAVLESLDDEQHVAQVIYSLLNPGHPVKLQKKGGRS